MVCHVTSVHISISTYSEGRLKSLEANLFEQGWAVVDGVVIENEGKCGRHLHANAIRSQISQAENDGVKAEVRTITPKDGTTMHSRPSPSIVLIHRQIRRLLHIRINATAANV